MAKRKGISIRDVARESGASLTTVSLVLNNRECRISDETRQRVIRTVDRLGYRPSRLAQGLQAQRSGLLAVLVPQLGHVFADPYFGELICAIQETAAGAGYKLLLEVVNEAYIKSEEHLELFRRHYVDGMLCLGVTNFDAYLGEFAAAGHPMVVVNNYLPDIRLNHVICEYEEAGRIAGRHLADLGHREIGLIHGAPEVQTTNDLRRGLELELGSCGIKLLDDRIEDGLYTEEGGAQAAVNLMNRVPGITAIFGGNDKMAIGAMSALKASGFSVPGDVSVMGCDDMHQAAFCDPPLTTVHTPLDDVGERACRALLELVDGKREAVADTCPVSLTLRQSTCAPRQHDLHARRS